MLRCLPRRSRASHSVLERWALTPRWYRERMTKADLHALVDALPDAPIDPAGELLRRAQDPVVAKLDAAPQGRRAARD